MHQCCFSATKSNKFFTLEHRELPFLVDGGGNSTRRTAAVIMMYDLLLKWTFAVHVFPPNKKQAEQQKEYDPRKVEDETMAQWRFYVVPFCQLTHATTEADVLLCSDGTLIAIDYSSQDPKISCSRAANLSFDVFGGESDGFCCTVQWLCRDECNVRRQGSREAAARNASDRASLRVARSSYLSSLAKELQELERDANQQKALETRKRPPSEVFGGLEFAEKLLLFPYGDQMNAEAPLP